jgi:hypothetical protein
MHAVQMMGLCFSVGLFFVRLALVS